MLTNVDVVLLTNIDTMLTDIGAILTNVDLMLAGIGPLLANDNSQLANDALLLSNVVPMPVTIGQCLPIVVQCLLITSLLRV